MRLVRRVVAVVAIATAMLFAVIVLDPGEQREPQPVEQTTLPPQGAPPAATLPDPCALVTGDDVTAAYERPLTSNREGERVCVHVIEHETAEAGGTSLRVTVERAPSGVAHLEKERSVALGAVGAGSLTDLPGLGEAAFVVTTVDGLSLLRAVCGEVSLVIALAGAIPDPLTLLTDLATQAMARM